jgi:hypothetical protein
MKSSERVVQGRCDATTQCNDACVQSVFSHERQDDRKRSQSFPRYDRGARDDVDQVRFGGRERSLATACHFCHRVGHMKRDCRRRLGRCLVCGSNSHMVATCPRRQVDRRGSFGSVAHNRNVRFDLQNPDLSCDSLNRSSPSQRGSPRR